MCIISDVWSEYEKCFAEVKIPVKNPQVEEMSEKERGSSE